MSLLVNLRDRTQSYHLFREEATTFAGVSPLILKHSRGLGEIVIFESYVEHPYAPAFNIFPLMWAKAFYELGYSVHLVFVPRSETDFIEVKNYIENISFFNF